MDKALMMLAKDVRGKTLRILDGLTDEQVQTTAPGLNNSILWHAGHAYVVVEQLATARITGSADLPDGWFDKFSWKSDPTKVTSWPAIADVRTKLSAQLEKLTALIESLSDEQLEKIIDPAKNSTLRYSILHGLHDEAGHQGEMWLIKKLLKKQQSPQ
jgi:hypothetical protein